MSLFPELLPWVSAFSLLSVTEIPVSPTPVFLVSTSSWFLMSVISSFLVSEAPLWTVTRITTKSRSPFFLGLKLSFSVAIVVTVCYICPPTMFGFFPHTSGKLQMSRDFKNYFEKISLDMNIRPSFSLGTLKQNPSVQCYVRILFTKFLVQKFCWFQHLQPNTCVLWNQRIRGSAQKNTPLEPISDARLTNVPKENFNTPGTCRLFWKQNSFEKLWIKQADQHTWDRSVISIGL